MDQRHDKDKQAENGRHRGGVTHLQVAERFLPHIEHDRRGAVLGTAGRRHDGDFREQLRAADDARDDNEESNRLHHRPRDAPKFTKCVRPVYLGRFVIVSRNALQSRQVQQHRVAETFPDQHQDDGRFHGRDVIQPIGSVDAYQIQRLVEQAEIAVVGQHPHDGDRGKGRNDRNVIDGAKSGCAGNAPVQSQRDEHGEEQPDRDAQHHVERIVHRFVEQIVLEHFFEIVESDETHLAESVPIGKGPVNRIAEREQREQEEAQNRREDKEISIVGFLSVQSRFRFHGSPRSRSRNENDVSSRAGAREPLTSFRRA